MSEQERVRVVPRSQAAVLRFVPPLLNKKMVVFIHAVKWSSDFGIFWLSVRACTLVCV